MHSLLVDLLLIEVNVDAVSLARDVNGADVRILDEALKRIH